MKKSPVAIAVLGAIGGSGPASAAIVSAELIGVASGSPNGESVGTLGGTVLGTYNDASGVLTMDSGTTSVRFNTSPTTVLFTHNHTNWTTGGGAYSATDYSCAEGTFGGNVGAHLCGNYNFGTNFLNDSNVNYNIIPGTRTVGGDDVIIGPQQQGVNYATTEASIANGVLTMQSALWNGAGTNPSDGGIELLFGLTGVAVDDAASVQESSPGDDIAIGANDRYWAANPTVTNTTIGTGVPLGGTFVINSDPDIANVTAAYTPPPGVTGTDTWSYTVTNTEGAFNGQSDAATVTVTVSALGTANPDTGDTTSLTAPADIPIGFNDVGFTDPSIVTITVPASQGDVTINDNNGPPDSITATYTSTAALGSAPYQDTFTYLINDGTRNDTAVVTVNVNNSLPVANDLAGVTLDTQGVSPSNVSTDIDVGPGGDIAGNANGDGTPTVTRMPANDVTTEVNGTVITITAVAFTSAGDTVGYTITDVDTEADTGTIGVSIPDVIPTVQDVQETVDSGGSQTITVGYQLGNGALSDHTETVSQPQFGTVTDVMLDAANSQVSFVYTPTDVGIEMLTVDLRDGDGSIGTGTVTITIPDDVPQVQSVTQTIAFAGGTEIAVASVLGTGDASAHTVSVTGAQWGQVSDVALDDTGSPITFTYTPAGFAATDVLTISLTDANGDVGNGTATLTITGAAVTIPPQDSLPGTGGSTALSPATLGLLLSIPMLLRGRRRRR